ncbi:hypothetical protein Goklo_002548 [Gossypium klotzschianum]|uniref:Uncharacterized protein n=1 Tax=Gossypium klotzschianum TaxID=34286 RepID=A0A7J8VTF3_9ROSI|nr:hypothetical protein [Gossypium klotzschianum]
MNRSVAMNILLGNQQQGIRFI